MPSKYKGQTAYQTLYGKSVLLYSMSRSWDYQPKETRDLSIPQYLLMETQRVETLRCSHVNVARTGHTGSYNYFGYGDVWAPLEKGAEQIARRRFSALAQSTASTLVTALEAGKTLSMVRYRTKGLADAAGALLQGKIRKFASILNTQSISLKRKFALKAEHRRYTRRQTMRKASSLWLEYRFGWAPIVYDIDDHMAALADRVPKADSIRSSAKYPPPAGRYEKLRDRTIGYRDSYEGPIWGRTECVLGGVVTVSNPFEYYRRRFGVSPSEAAWELTPYSWAVDYFVDLQGYLQGISAFAGLSLTNGWRTDVRHQWSPIRVRDLDNGWNWHNHDYVYRRFSCRRVRMHTFPPYSHTWWDLERINVSRTCNLLAASVQKLLRITPKQRTR